MPPKANKKKNKTSKSTAKEIARQTSKPLGNLELKVSQLENEWEKSSQKRVLKMQIRDKINTQKAIFIDNAICLGLGTLEKDQFGPLPGYTYGFVSAEKYRDYDDSDTTHDLQRFKPVADGKPRSMRLYQLIVFETVIEYLREKFLIGAIRFQDPSFTRIDEEFLRRRGHIVIEWDSSQGSSISHMDQRLTEFLSATTFCYLPYLDLNIVVSVIHAAKPCLYLGTDLIGTTVQHNLLRREDCNFLMDTYETIVLACDFDPVLAFSGNDGMPDNTFGFMWPADLDSQEVRERLTVRNNLILEKTRLAWSLMDEFLKKKKAMKEAKKETVEEEAVKKV